MQRALIGHKDCITGMTAPSNIIFEVRVSEGNEPPSSRYWTVFGVFNPQNKLNIGRWRLPLYECPTELNTKMEDVP
jgi:hypothetical protein